MTTPELLGVARYSAWQRLYDRYQIQPAGIRSGAAYLSPVLQPVTDLDELLKDFRAVTGTKSFTAGSAAISGVYTVPDGKRETVRALFVERDSGDNTFVSVHVQDVSAAVTVQLDLFAAATDYRYPGHPFVLEQKDVIHITAGGAGVAATVFRMDLLLDREDAW